MRVLRAPDHDAGVHGIHIEIHIALRGHKADGFLSGRPAVFRQTRHKPATNAQLVDRARSIMEMMGASIQTPEEARKTLGLRKLEEMKKLRAAA